MMTKAWIRGVAASIVLFGATLLDAPMALSVAVTQHPLKCAAGACNPASSVMPGAGGHVLASGVEGGAHVYSEVTLGPTGTVTPGPAGAPVSRLAPGPDGNPWGLSHVGPNPAVLDVTPHGVVTVYAYPNPEVQLLALTPGNASEWLLTNQGVDRLENGAPTHYELPGTLPLHEYGRGIVAGPSESAWVTAADGAIDQIPYTGKASEHSSEALPLDPVRASPGPYRIAIGPDGALWYTEPNRGRIARRTLAGSVEEFQVPSLTPPYDTANTPIPEGIVAGPEGQYMYFTDRGTNAIGRISMSGGITEYAVPGTTNVEPEDIAVLGSELVFDEHNSAAIGTINPTAAPGQAPLGPPPSLAAITTSLSLQAAHAPSPGKQAVAVAFSALEPGTVSLSWLAAPAAAPPKTKRHRARPAAAAPIVVATGKTTFNLPESQEITVSMTSAGRRLLTRGKKHTKLILRTTFSGFWAGLVEVRTARN